MKRKQIIIIGLIVIFIIAITFFITKGRKPDSQIVIPVKKGKFEIRVVTTGELQAENSEKINGPSGLRTIQIWNVKITDLVAEGTVIDSGAYVATLDRTEAMSKLKDIESELEKVQQQFIKTQLDTTLDLRALRDNIINLKFVLEERKITLDQSKYESPSTIRQAEIELDKAQRTYQQSLENYKLKVRQATALMTEINLRVDAQKRKQDEIAKGLNEFTIFAPKPGMVIYAREWNGAKRKVGSMISTWEPTVATLPDLSSMVSDTYVNEIDISKIKVNQPVDVGVDAFPDKKYTGKIISVANIGEQLPNTDAKVFKVEIKVNESDSILRPAMTTGNSILTATYEDVLFIPLEAIHANDSLTYVYKISGFKTIKQIVTTGESNENEIIIKEGLSPDDQILLSAPENEEK
jgi:RND family efflux transporter MFP subunit